MKKQPQVMENLPFTIDETRVLREMRVSRIKTVDELEERPLAEAMKRAIAKAYTLIHGKGVYKTIELGGVGEDGEVAAPSAPGLFTGKDMVNLLGQCPQATVLAVTIGDGLETEVERLDKAGDITEAYLLEMVGGLMADYMADRVDERIESSIQRAGFDRTMRYSPGYGDWPLERQPLLARIVEAERIGITVTQSHIMIPRKSVSAVIGWKRKA
ncbi:MAG: hypothetical protein OEY50_09375 [Nitrospinota bacterium]|nr:hypothetical protein [Nitrospinota bacterium]MDH5678523.1 hypothetical protein [Nitrospinota bacterium]